MKKVRLIFVGIMLALFCVGFTSCGHEEGDMDPVTLELIEDTASDDGGGEEDKGSSGS